MPRLTEQAHAAVRAVLTAGEWAVDGTAGNGHDTKFLAGVVGPTGRVFAFDVQPDALASTAAHLDGRDHVRLINRSHAELLDALPSEAVGRVGAVMFNLGYLPGGDKSVMTQADSTRAALCAALEVLRPGGVLTVVVYPGHPGGPEEAAAVAEVLGGAAEVGAGADNPTAPRLFVVHKRPAGGSL